jgi:transposase-like protein
VREVRKLTTSGHQVSLISTAFGGSALQDAAVLFSRWSQENFFHCMMQRFAIDLLNEYRSNFSITVGKLAAPLVGAQR